MVQKYGAGRREVTRRDTASSAAELGQNLIRGADLAALSFFVSAGDQFWGPHLPNAVFSGT
jgi:hypothetical protein